MIAPALMSVDYDGTDLAAEADERIRTFQADGSKRAGIFHHLITLPTYHTAALSTDNLSKEYFGAQGMLGYVRNVQRQEIRRRRRLRQAPEHGGLRPRRRSQGIFRRRSGPEGRRRAQHDEPVRLNRTLIGRRQSGPEREASGRFAFWQAPGARRAIDLLVLFAHFVNLFSAK